MIVRAVRLLLLSVVGGLLLAGSANAGGDAISLSWTNTPHRFVTVPAGKTDRLVVMRGPARKYAGHFIDWNCYPVPTGTSATWMDGGGGVRMRPGAVLGLGPRVAWCQVEVVIHKRMHFGKGRGRVLVRITGHLRQSIGVTAAGTAYVHRVQGAQRIDEAVGIAEFARDEVRTGSYPPFAAIAKDFPGISGPWPGLTPRRPPRASACGRPRPGCTSSCAAGTARPSSTTVT